MKKNIIIAIVLVALLSIVIISPSVISAEPEGFMPQEATLIKIIDEVEIFTPLTSEPDESRPTGAIGEAQNAKSHDKFKVYIKITPTEPIPFTLDPIEPNVAYTMIDSADWDEKGFSYFTVGGSGGWRAFPDPVDSETTNTYWALTYTFEEPTSEINCACFYMGGEGPDSFIVEAWLLMDN